MVFNKIRKIAVDVLVFREPPFGLLVHNELSPVPSRSFFKTDWTKPKFDPAKPYITSRRIMPKEKPILDKKDSTLQIKKTQQDENSKRHFSSKVSSIKKYGSNTHTSNENVQNMNLNIKELLLPSIASVSCVVIGCNVNKSK